MYWRAGIGFVALWVASLALAMSGMAALFLAGSYGAAACFLATAVVLAPPAHEVIAALRHRLAPSKAALYCCITLLPIGFGVLIVDAVNTLEVEARKRGFASAGELALAKDLKLSTPAQLAAHFAAERQAARDKTCREAGALPPLGCYGAGHQKAALQFFDAQIGQEQAAAIVRDAIAQQRKALLDADKECAALVDRIDAYALPILLQAKDDLRNLAAAAWAKTFNEKELAELAARAKPGVSYLSAPNPDALDKKARALAADVERGLDMELQARSRRIVRDEPFWQALMAGHAPITGCPAGAAAGRK